MKLSKQKSEDQAEIIKIIALQLQAVDVEYLKALSEMLIEKATRQRSIMALKPLHTNEANDLLETQGLALQALCKYIEILKRCDSIRAKIQQKISQQGYIDKMFL